MTGPDHAFLVPSALATHLRDVTDPENGGAFTLTRLRVGPFDADGRLVALRAAPDNRAFDEIQVGPDAGELRLIAEFLEVVG